MLCILSVSLAFHLLENKKTNNDNIYNQFTARCRMKNRCAKVSENVEVEEKPTLLHGPPILEGKVALEGVTI